MKAYICDSCHVTVTNPRWVRMMVYTYKPHPDPDHKYKKSEERKKRDKIHLCEMCFANLNKICEKASKERSEGK